MAPPAEDLRSTYIQTPTISHVWVKRAGESTEQRFPYARINDTLVLYGTSLSGPVE